MGDRLRRLHHALRRHAWPGVEELGGAVVSAVAAGTIESPMNLPHALTAGLVGGAAVWVLRLASHWWSEPTELAAAERRELEEAYGRCVQENEQLRKSLAQGEGHKSETYRLLLEVFEESEPLVATFRATADEAVALHGFKKLRARIETEIAPRLADDERLSLLRADFDDWNSGTERWNSEAQLRHFRYELRHLMASYRRYPK